MSTSITLQSAVHARNFFDQALLEMTHGFQEGKRFRCMVQQETRRSSQNAHYHAILGQLAKAIPINGVLLDADSFKRICISAFRIETKDDPVLSREWAKFGEVRNIVGLRGEVVSLGEPSRQFSVKLAAAFIAWLEALAAEHSVRLMAPKSWQEQV